MGSSSTSLSSEEEEQTIRNWVDLPYDLTANILHRLGAFEILENAQKVCTYWYKICKDPAMWRVIDINFHPNILHDLGVYWWSIKIDRKKQRKLEKMCMHAVDRSRGQLVDISIVFFGKKKILRYISQRSSQLRRLKLVECEAYFGLKTAVKRLPLLEELHLYNTCISLPQKTIQTIGQFCPRLKSFKYDGNKKRCRLEGVDIKAIAENMRGLRHLSIFGKISKAGLKAILDKLAHLESLDLSQCNFELKGGLLVRCLSQIVDLKCPYSDSEAELRRALWESNRYASFEQFWSNNFDKVTLYY